MLTGVPEEHTAKLLATKLQFNPDYYKIVDLTAEEEESKEMNQLIKETRNIKRKNT